jgi:hypothetical protein
MDIKPTRKFFLFEPYPDFFLAMQTNKIANVKKYKSMAPKFVKKMWLVKNGEDENNGIAFLNIMNAYADVELKEQKLFYGHTSHCILNQLGRNATEEAGWYYLLLKERLAMMKKLKKRKRK